MSIAGDKTKERQLENVLLGGRRRRPKENSQEIIQSAAKLSNAISTTARSLNQRSGTKGSKQNTGKIAQALALQKALVPELAKKGRGRYKTNLRASGKSATGNIVKSKRSQNPRQNGEGAKPHTAASDEWRRGDFSLPAHIRIKGHWEIDRLERQAIRDGICTPEIHRAARCR
jgi:hypothetical protein